jgi:hypothetical protein
MSPTQPAAPRRTGSRARSALWLLVVLAALTSCADVGRPDDAQPPERTVQVGTGVDRHAENENEADEHENESPWDENGLRGLGSREHESRGTARGGNEHEADENEAAENESEADERESDNERGEHEADEN